MNATERSIKEQFPYWRTALGPDLELARLKPDILTVAIGCGTSYHLVQAIAASLNAHDRLALAVPGGEWNLRRQNYVPEAQAVQVLAFSCSGATTETVAAAHASLERGERVIGVTCEPDSSLTLACTGLPTHPLEGIVMTASASLMLLVGLRLGEINIAPEDIERALQMLEQLGPQLDALAHGCSHFVYLGGGALYGIANEGALKLMEMSLSHAQAYHPVEYRHEPISLVGERRLAVMLYQPDTLEESKLVGELRGKGARVLGLGGPGDLSHELAASEPALRGVTALPTLQWLGEGVAQGKGLDTRAPRHLTKVVVLP